jgi:CheY-like chemotaxis protein
LVFPEIHPAFKGIVETAERIEAMKRILVVDDEPSVLLGICNSLRGRRDEWEPVLAIDTEEACSRLDAAPDIDVLVCDLAMPGEGGVRVLRHAMEKHPHIARIVLSGKARGEIANEARQLCDRLLEKPCPPDVLRETIQWAINRFGEPQHQK